MSGEQPATRRPISKPGEGDKPLPREARRQVVVDVLAIAVVDLLLDARGRDREARETTTC